MVFSTTFNSLTRITITVTPVKTFVLVIDRCWFIQVKLTNISYTGNLFKVRFIHDFNLFMVPKTSNFD